jgi:hypothetical protein
MSGDHTEPESTSAPAHVPALPEANLTASSDALTEDQALAQLEQRDLMPEQIEAITRHPAAMKSRKVRLALAAHPRVPRSLALKLIREFYTFDLMRFALVPAVAADLKRLADELLIGRLSSITLGERISLARRSSGRIAAALLLDKEAQVWQLALDNPRLNETGVIGALHHGQVSPLFVRELCQHKKWSVRREIRVALLRNAHTPLAQALEFAHGIPEAQLRDILYSSRLPQKMKLCLSQAIDTKLRTEN